MDHNKVLYHGSKTGGLKILKPNPHNAVGKKPVVFAASDPRFALAMICGTGDEIAVGYVVNIDTHEEQMYIDELAPGKLQLLNAPGYLYEVAADSFRTEPALSHVEFVTYREVPVLKETYLKNIFEELKKYAVEIVSYKDVPEAMKRRGKTVGEPENPYAPDRFREVE